VVSTTTCVPIFFRRRPNEKGLQFVKSSLSDFNIRIFCYKVNVGISLSLFNNLRHNQSETSEVESYPVYENLGEIIDVALCPKVNGSYKKCCLDRKCTECGVGKLKFSMNVSFFSIQQ
jgi:hypothetical protein